MKYIIGFFFLIYLLKKFILLKLRIKRKDKEKEIKIIKVKEEGEQKILTKHSKRIEE